MSVRACVPCEYVTRETLVRVCAQRRMHDRGEHVFFRPLEALASGGSDQVNARMGAGGMYLSALPRYPRFILVLSPSPRSPSRPLARSRP
eukprot:6196035-Pleurochrysis_carterae.AAC.1